MMVTPAIERGSGPLTFVLLHYFGSSGHEWEPVMDQLSGRFRCLAPDLRGFGDNTSAPYTDYSVEAMTDDVATLIRSRVPGPFILVGHSMSGKVALALASRQPAGLVGLVLLAPSPPSPEPMTDEARQQLLMQPRTRQMAEDGIRQTTAAPLSDDYRERIIQDERRASPIAWRAWVESGSQEDITAQLGMGLAVPALVLVGAEDDHLGRVVQQQFVIPYLPQGTVEEVPGVGHVLPLEAPDTIAQRMARFTGSL